MNNGFFDDCEGPIQGLWLPLDAWNALQVEGITTMDQLRTMAKVIQWLPDIGSEMAVTIRVELGRVELLEALFPESRVHVDLC